MLNVFTRLRPEDVCVQLSDKTTKSLIDLVSDYENLRSDYEKLLIDYEKLINEKNHQETSGSELKPGKWFRIDREIINNKKDEIRRNCFKVGSKGEELWSKFKWANKIAESNPRQYPRLIDTYIFPRTWEYKTIPEMRYMCFDVGDGMCDEVICYLELQMRICNGESVDNLVEDADKLPNIRVIKFTNGRTGYFGGCNTRDNNMPPAKITKGLIFTLLRLHQSTPYAYRLVPEN